MSREVFHLPDVGEGLIEADIVAWKVAVGDRVALNQPLADIETAKAVVELPSPYEGTVVELHGAVGDTVAVESPFVTFETSEAAPHAAPKEVVHGEEDLARREPVLIGYGVSDEAGASTQRPRRSHAEPPAATSAAAPASSARGPVRTTPPVRLLAKTLGVDLTRVAATGREGVVTRQDVERAANLLTPAPRVPSGPTRRFAGVDLASWDEGPREERIALKGVVKTMAEAMTTSVRTQPQAVVWLRVDATKTTTLVRGLKERAQSSGTGVRVSPLTIIALAVCDAIRHYPGINSSIDEERGEIVVRRVVNLGIAADTPRGLLVPNVKDADRLGVAEMARALSTLVDDARRSATTPADMSGGTFTITNVGPFGVDAAMAILPPGTGAILCVGAITPSPWVSEGELVVRDVVELALTFDHRQIDGALASLVIAHIGAFLEDPAPRLLLP